MSHDRVIKGAKGANKSSAPRRRRDRRHEPFEFYQKPAKAEMLEMAVKLREEGRNDPVPYWIFEPEDSCEARRYAPILPHSRDKEHIQNLKRSLVAYRMVLGQPRQEDFVEYLRQKPWRDALES
jgi:hypothetical protein